MSNTYKTPEDLDYSRRVVFEYLDDFNWLRYAKDSILLFKLKDAIQNGQTLETLDPMEEEVDWAYSMVLPEHLIVACIPKKAYRPMVYALRLDKLIKQPVLAKYRQVFGPGYVKPDKLYLSWEDDEI